MGFDFLTKRVARQYKDQLPFVVYRKPKKKSCKAIFQNDTKLHTTSSFKEKAFVFAPFDSASQAVIFPIDACELATVCNLQRKQDLITSKQVIKTIIHTEHLKNNHIKLIEKGLHFLATGVLEKVVLSRKETVEIKGFASGEELFYLFEKMLQQYPNAFVYFWFHPSIGLWMGATPEKLFSLRNASLKTVALAATKKAINSKKLFWTQKEKEEQNIVTNYLENTLKEYVFNIQISEPKPHKAGSLIHLQTKVKAIVKPSYCDVSFLIDKLHPTPAVCGTPEEEAKQFILKNEGYKREFYSGFLGEINFKKSDKEGFAEKSPTKTDLYVNLRCMKISSNKANLFVGGGITKDSNALQEWEETVNKTHTMLQILS